MSSDPSTPSEAERYEFEARALIDRRRHDQARAKIAAGLKHHPDDPALLYLSAFVDYAEDRNDQARATLDALLSREPLHYGARTLMAHIYEEMNQFQRAESYWIDLLREYPEDPDLLGNYGLLMLRTLHVDKAERLAREGLRFEPEHRRCLYLAALVDLVRGGSRHTDTTHLRRLLAEHPEDTRSAITLILALNDRGQFAAALRVGQELLRSQPDSKPIVKLVRALKAESHWSMIPLYPMQRWGWGGAFAVTVLGILLLGFASRVVPEAVLPLLTVVWLGYVVYSWVWPSILRRIV